MKTKAIKSLMPPLDSPWKDRYVYFTDPKNDAIPLSWMLSLMSGKPKMEYYREMGISITSIIAWDKGKRLPGAGPLEKALIGTGISWREVYDRQSRIYPELKLYKRKGSIGRTLGVDTVKPESEVACDTTTDPEMMTLPSPDTPVVHRVTVTEFDGKDETDDWAHV